MKNENTYIMNLEGAYLYKDIINQNKITYKKRDLSKLFSATMPYSLEAIRMNKLFEDVFYQVNKKQYTRCIINVTFEKHYTMWDADKNKRRIKANKKKVRSYLYKHGFTMDGYKYVFYKRGAGKAKNGYAFFIRDYMRDPLINRSRLNIQYQQNEELDLTSLLAYESLISSGIDFTINLDPKKEILLIDDIYGEKFECIASITKEVNKKLVTKNESITLQNCLTDGQGLLDESVFENYNKDGKGFMLLRSDMFKCCGFNTKLQKWFTHNNITELTDMFGTVYEAKNIKLITTPNSLKFLKFAYKIGSGSKKECYDYWKDNIDDIFGVVKCDKQGNFGNYNRTTYQLLNSIPNLTYEDLMEITKLEREYVTLLKNDIAVFRNYLGCDVQASIRLQESIKKGSKKKYETADLMHTLMLVNSDLQYTKKFKEMRRKLISNYISHLRKGKIRLKDTKYITIVSNPYQMLLASIGQYNKESIMKGREIYCPYYEDGQEFCATRNPHINSGNVMYTINKYHKEYDEWFNFNENICAINFFDNDAPDRLQGCDTDSDTLLLLPLKVLSTKALYCEKTFATPINKVEGSAIPRKYNMEELCKLDITLSDNYIGKIVNMSQIINSYMNEAISSKQDLSMIDELYQLSSRLSSMSQIEIDKSKKVFDNVNMSKELSILRSNKYLKYVEDTDRFDKLVNKMVVPTFLNVISESNDYRVLNKFNTPLDILQDVLQFNKCNRIKTMEFVDLLVTSSRNVEGRYRVNSAKAIFKIIEKCGKKINGLRLTTCTLNYKAKRTVKLKAQTEAVVELKNIKSLSTATILRILMQSFGSKTNDTIGFKKYSLLTLNLLFQAYPILVLNCFINENIYNDKSLVECQNNSTYEYDIFGKKYKLMTRENIS
ncbi:MAG: hypothetical protein GY714_23555 [Desulfobacterales bacterium]|nr:hypothetical protein [Desulfobacterales bacterium]